MCAKVGDDRAEGDTGKGIRMNFARFYSSGLEITSRREKFFFCNSGLFHKNNARINQSPSPPYLLYSHKDFTARSGSSHLCRQ